MIMATEVISRLPYGVGRFSRGWFVAAAILLTLVGLGAYAFSHQITEGDVISLPWGLYIVGFVFFIGASSGATIIGLLIHAFGREDYAPLGTRALLVGLLALAGGTLFMAVDVGSFPRMMLVPWVWRNFSSMFFYTSISYYIFGLLLLAELYYTVKITRETASARDKNIAKWLAIGTFLFAVWVVQVLDGSLFGAIKASEYWNTHLSVPHFVMAALLSGIAIMILVAIVTSATRGKGLVSKVTLAHMGQLLAFFIAATLFLDLVDILILSYSDTVVSRAAWTLLTGQNVAWFVLNLTTLFAALVILLFKGGRTSQGLFIASSLALVGIVVYRFNVVIVGQLAQILPHVEGASYSPSLVEVLVTLGVVALVLFLYTVLSRVLPMEDKQA
jgi:molybdopterin-containing oxidoreductase family membrane subunit